MRLQTLGARCVALYALLPVVLAGGPLVSADEPAPALITLDDGAGAGGRELALSERAMSARGHALLDAVRSDPLASGLRVGMTSREVLAEVMSGHALSLPAVQADGGVKALAFRGAAVVPSGGGMISLRAEDRAADTDAAFVVDGLDVLGSFRSGRDTWYVRPLGEGRTAVYRYDTARLRQHPRGWGRWMMKNRARMLTRPLGPSGRRGVRSGPSAAPPVVAGSIDILVVYTEAAATAAGNIDAYIQLGVDNTNRVWSRSGVGWALRLVGTRRVDYTEVSFFTAIDHLSIDTGDEWLSDDVADPDGYMDEVHDWRDGLGADLVMLMISRGQLPVGEPCGVAWLGHFAINENNPSAGGGTFSVVGTDCESVAYSVVAHEIGHNMGGEHNPPNAGDIYGGLWPYRHGRCDVEGGWHTTMSYAYDGEGGRCDRRIPLLSSPSLTWDGRPTGDAAVSDVLRVHRQAAPIVAGFRGAVPTQVDLPLVSADGDARQTMVRIMNRWNRAGGVRIEGFDSEGVRHGPIGVSLAPGAVINFNSAHIESGDHPALDGGLGDGAGSWWLRLRSELDFEALAYMREGYLGEVHSTAREVERGRWRLPTFQPGDNRSKLGILRVVNAGGGVAAVTVSGVDDAGDPAPGGTVRFSLRPHASVQIDARDLERGGAGLTGALGDGAGKWRLDVTANEPLMVMGMVRSEAALANISRGRE